MEDTVKKTGRRGRTADLVLIVLFLAVICLPASDLFLKLDPSPTSAENKPAPAVPKLARPISVSSVVNFGRAMRRYITDDYGFRRVLLGLSNRVEGRLFGRFATPDVVLGQDGWLIYNNENNQFSNRRFTEKELDRWRSALEWRRDWCRARGIPYLVVFVPKPPTIYPEVLPDFTQGIDTPSRLEDLVTSLASKTDLDVLDLRRPMREARELDRLYHRTDTHWNELGAYVGYRSIMERVARSLPVKAMSLEDFAMETKPGLGGDLAGMIALRHVLPEDEILLIPKHPRRATSEDGGAIPYKVVARSIIARISDSPDLPRAVMIRDSFGSALIPLLSEHFSRIVYRWRTLIQDEEPFPVEVIEREKPQIVIDEFAERMIDFQPPRNPTLDGAKAALPPGR